MEVDQLTKWKRRQQYLECQMRGTHVVYNPDNCYRRYETCSHCGTEFRFETVMVEQKIPQPALCNLYHHKGVSCPNSDCIWNN